MSDLFNQVNSEFELALTLKNFSKEINDGNTIFVPQSRAGDIGEILLGTDDVVQFSVSFGQNPSGEYGFFISALNFSW